MVQLRWSWYRVKLRKQMMHVCLLLSLLQSLHLHLHLHLHLRLRLRLRLRHLNDQRPVMLYQILHHHRQ